MPEQQQQQGKEERPKWYSPFVLLVGTILSLADPVTDIITAVEFYRADHKIWFGVGLGFVFLHNFVALFFLCCFYNEHDSREKLLSLCPLCFFFGPFFCFYIRLRELVRCLKRLWNRNVDDTNEFHGDENSRYYMESETPYCTFSNTFISREQSTTCYLLLHRQLQVVGHRRVFVTRFGDCNSRQHLQSQRRRSLQFPSRNLISPFLLHPLTKR